MSDIEKRTLVEQLKSNAAAYELLGEKELPRLLRRASAALALPGGYVPERQVLAAATNLRRLASAASPLARKAYIQAAEAVEMAVIAARPEVP